MMIKLFFLTGQFADKPTRS